MILFCWYILRWCTDGNTFSLLRFKFIYNYLFMACIVLYCLFTHCMNGTSSREILVNVSAWLVNKRPFTFFHFFFHTVHDHSRRPRSIRRWCRWSFLYAVTINVEDRPCPACVCCAQNGITILVVMFVSFLYVMATALVVLVVSNVSRYGMTVYDIGDHSLTWRWWTLRYLLQYDALWRWWPFYDVATMDLDGPCCILGI